MRKKKTLSNSLAFSLSILLNLQNSPPSAHVLSAHLTPSAPLALLAASVP
jgi:hypothetical protein